MTSPPINKQIAELRVARQLTQMQLAKRTGMKQSRISALERAARQNNLSLRTLRRIAKALGAELQVNLVMK